jgi:hydrogenase nickel incorporation protein HypA/HybF
MHEFGLCEGVLDTVRQRAGGRRVTAVRVRFGVRHAVDEESLAQAFAMMAEGTEAAGAAVELVTVPAAIVCPDCGFSGETTDLLATCPRCASPNAQVSGGDEMVLESITYAAPPPAAPPVAAPPLAAPPFAAGRG